MRPRLFRLRNRRVHSRDFLRCILRRRARFRLGNGTRRVPKETLSRYADAECFDWTRVALITAITRASADTVCTKGVRRGFAATNVFSLCTRGSPVTLSRHSHAKQRAGFAHCRCEMTMARRGAAFGRWTLDVHE